MIMSAKRRAILLALAAVVSVGGIALQLPEPAAAQVPAGEEFQINVYTTGHQSSSAVASHDDGSFVVVWGGVGPGTGYAGSVFARRYDASGAPIDDAFQVNGYSTDTQANPDIAMDEAGNFVVVWQSDTQDGSENGIFGQRFDSAGDPLGGEFQINSFTTGHQSFPSVAADSDGDFVVVWHGSGSTDISGIFGQRFDAAGTPLGGEFRANATTTSAQSDPAVESTADGDFVVAWVSHYQAGSPAGLRGQRFDASGAPVGGELGVNTVNRIFFSEPEVAFDPAGGFVVVWDGYSYYRTEVWGRRYESTGIPSGNEFPINVYWESYQYVPHIAWGPGGGFVATWSSRGQDGSLDGVYGRLLDENGAPFGAEFQVNSYTTSFQFIGDVAADGDGDFVVTWTSTNGQDGDLDGVFGQRYTDPDLALVIDGSCPGAVTAEVSSAPPNSEVAVIAAANTNGFTKGGALCPGTRFEIGEPFQLPPRFVIVDGNGNGSTNLTLGANRCHVQALALQSCETSNVAVVP
jgi:hypothetical protein